MEKCFGSSGLGLVHSGLGHGLGLVTRGLVNITVKFPSTSKHTISELIAVVGCRKLADPRVRSEHNEIADPWIGEL